MKKILFTLSVVAALLFMGSCADDDNGLPQPLPPTTMGFVYTGSLQVGSFSMDDATVAIEINGGYMSITMRGVKFSDKMPMTLDIVLDGIPCIEGDGVLMFSCSDIVPLVAGKADEAYRFKFIAGRVNADATGITFVAQMAEDLAAHVAGMVFAYDAGQGSGSDVVPPPSVDDFSYGFTGTLQAGGYVQPSASVSVAVNREAGTVDIKMNGVKFSDRMPMALDITLCGLVCENVNGKMVFSGSDVVPLIGTVSSENYTFASVSGEFDMGSSTLLLNARMASDLAQGIAGVEFVYNGNLNK